MEITINIQAPQLAHAIETLAIAIGCTVDKIGVGQAIEEAVQQNPAPKETKEIKETKKAEETKAAAPAQEPDSKAEAAAEEGPILTIEQVREAFMSKNTKSNTAKLKAILKKFNVAKVTDLPEEHFADVLKELEAI